MDVGEYDLWRDNPGPLTLRGVGLTGRRLNFRLWIRGVWVTPHKWGIPDKRQFILSLPKELEAGFVLVEIRRKFFNTL